MALEGSLGTIRRLWPTDRDLLRDHLLRLDPETRRSRFHAAVDDTFLASHVAQAFASEVEVYGFLSGGMLRGAAELRALGDGDPAAAEAAFTIEAPFRRQGIGSALFRRVMLNASNRGIRTLHVRCLPHNHAMRALARRCGARLLFDSGEVLGRVETDSPTPFSWAQETLIESLTFPMALLRIFGQQRSDSALPAIV